MHEGRYQYVKYDRRNGPIKTGTPMYLKDLSTFEVTEMPDGCSLMGYSIMNLKWPWWERAMWFLTGKREKGRWSPIRFFFIQVTGYISASKAS